MPRGIAKTGQRARRRTKAEMQAARGVAVAAPAKEKAPVPGKRHRRTKAEMQAFRASLAAPAPAPAPAAPVACIMEPVQPARAPAPTVRQAPAKQAHRPSAEASEREKAGRALHATSLLSFLPWVELSRASREEFCVEAENNACNAA